MALEKNIKLKVTVDTKQAEQGLGKVDKSISRIGLSLKTMGTALIAGFGANFIKSSINQFIESERVASKLASTLNIKTTALQNFAKELQKTTRFEDDAIVNGMALIGLYIKDEATLKRVTKATLDLASAKQMDLGTAFDVMTKAVSGNVGMLGRYGIRIEQTKNKSKDLELALVEINKTMGGSSESEKNTTYGKVESLKNAFGDLQENIGEVATKGLTPLLNKLNELVVWVNENGKTIETIFNIGTFGMFNLGKGGQVPLTKEQQDWINKTQKTLGENSGLGDLKRDRNRINNLADQFKEAETPAKTIENITKKMAENVERVAKGLQPFWATGAKRKSRFNMNLVDQPDKPLLGFDDQDVMNDFYKENSFLIEQMRGDLQTLQGEFNNFWNGTFGEANSLLEKFFQNFANGFFDLASKSILSTFLDFVPGGEFFKLFIEGRQSNPRIENNIIIDGRQTAIIYTNGKYNASRLRLE